MTSALNWNPICPEEKSGGGGGGSEVTSHYSHFGVWTWRESGWGHFSFPLTYPYVTRKGTTRLLAAEALIGTNLTLFQVEDRNASCAPQFFLDLLLVWGPD